MSNPNDQHVIPTSGREHMAAPHCWCGPRVDDGVPHSSGARVWIHNERSRAADLGLLCIAGTATPDEMIEYAILELHECGDCLPPSAPDNGRVIDGHHASACALRAIATLHQLRKAIAR